MIETYRLMVGPVSVHLLRALRRMERSGGHVRVDTVGQNPDNNCKAVHRGGCFDFEARIPAGRLKIEPAAAIGEAR
jgi:chloramphenicol 3-O-phosphotransferase